MVRADVPLSALEAEAEVVIGSFTVDGLTYAIDGEGRVALVAVAPLEGAEGVEAEGEGSGAEGAEPEADGEPDGIQLESDGEANGAPLTLPAVVSYGGTDYSLVRIAPLALDGCGAAALSIPASVETVDTAAALGCDTLAEVTVADDNPSFSAFDGYLADKAQTSILLVPEGRVGQLRIASTIQDLDPRAFSHCTRIISLDADAGCPGLTSWNGSIYTSDLATLVRVPAGARSVTLPPECSAIGASAFSGCTELESIEAQGSIVEIAPSAFGEIEEATPLVAQSDTAQITGLVAVANSALSSIQIDKASITVTLLDGADPVVWDSAGFTHVASSKGDETTTDLGEAEGSAPGTLASSVISEDKLLVQEDVPEAATQSALTYEADPSDPLYQRLLEKYKDDKFLDPENGVTPESLAEGAYDALMKYGKPQQIGSVNAWWSFSEDSDGALILKIWSESASAIIPRLWQSNAEVTPGASTTQWGPVRQFVERLEMLEASQESPRDPSVSTAEIRTRGMEYWYGNMVRLTDVKNAYVTSDTYAANGASLCISINGMFQNCLSLETLPEGFTLELRRGIPSGTEFYWGGIFSGCSALKSLPSSFRFPAYGGQVYVYNTFQGCTSLSSLPEGLVLSTRLYGGDMFAGCTSLVSIPSSFILRSTSASTSTQTKQTIGSLLTLPQEAKPLTTYYSGSSLASLTPHSQLVSVASDTNATSYWLDNYGRNLKARQANNVLFFIPRMDATGDESIQSWVAVDRNGQPSAEAEQGSARNADGTIARPTSPDSKRSGYGFVGWYKDPAYTEIFDFKHDTVDDYACLWGKFEEGPYTITYLDGTGTDTEIADSAEVSVDPEFFLQPTFHSGEKVIIDAVPVREGYEFLGWIIEGITGDTPQKQAVIPAGTTGDKVAVAHWAELPKRNYLITTADAAAGYTVDDFPVETGVSSPKAWWTLDNKGELYINCDTESGMTATVSKENFKGWTHEPASSTTAWCAPEYRNKVKSIVTGTIQAEQTGPYPISANDVGSNVSSKTLQAGYHDGYPQGMSRWFTWMESLTDISGVKVPEGTCAAFLFYGCWRLETFEGAHGVFEMPDSGGTWSDMFSFTGLTELPEDFSIPSNIVTANFLFEGTKLESLPNTFNIPATLKQAYSMFGRCYLLQSLPEDLILSDNTTTLLEDLFRLEEKYEDSRWSPEFIADMQSRIPSDLATNGLKTFYGGHNIARMYPGLSGQGASATKAYWKDNWMRDLVAASDLVSPQVAVRFQVPKADGSGYVSYDVLADSSGRVTAPAVTRYGYSKVTWRYDTGASGAELGHVAVSGPCGSEGLAFEATGLPDIEAGLKGPVYAEVSGLMLSMDMPVGSGNLWYAIDCGEVMALGPSASTRAGMEDAHELSFESYTPVPTKLSATFTANDAADGTPAAEKLFPNGLDEGTGFALSLDGGASETAGLKALIGAGGSQGFSSLASLDASPSVREPGRASGTLALKLGGANDVDFAEEATEYSVADIVWTLDASAQYDFWATDDVATYSTYEIKQAAEAISAYGATADVPAFRQYDRYLKQQSPDADPVFSIKVYDQPDGTASTHKVDVLGIAQDTKASGGKAGLTFGFKDAYLQGTNDCRMRSTATNSGGWNSSDLKKYLNGTFVSYLGASVSEGIVVAAKRQQQYGSSSLQATNDAKLFVPSYFEVYGISYAYWNGNETASNSFQYANFAKGGQSTENTNALKSYGSAYIYWWLRSASKTKSTDFARVSNSGICNDGSVANLAANSQNGIVPCFCF